MSPQLPQTDGRYEVISIPPGEYKVYFNTYNEAEPWVDELYDNVPCNNGSCDLTSEGDVLIITEGNNVLDVELFR